MISPSAGARRRNAPSTPAGGSHQPSAIPVALLLTAFAVPATAATSLGGWITAEGTWFAEEGAFVGQDYQASAALAAAPELRADWDGGRQQVRVIAFGRIDQRDDERTHADLREASWLYAGQGWEGWLGVRQVFWGVTESRHLVDVVNQVDLVEDVRESAKLGQPMASLALIRDWGGVELHALAGFRERTFPGVEGRLRPAVPIAVDDPIYDADGAARHLGVAARATRRWRELDAGVSVFHGTVRDPRLEAAVVDGALALRPHYDVVDQIGVDVQWTTRFLLLKAEAIQRGGQGAAFAALVAGVEHPWPGIAGTSWDLDLFAEYAWDERGADATTPYQDDLFLAARLRRNDAADTRFTVGGYYDTTFGSVFGVIEAQWRLSSQFTAAVRGLLFLDVPADDVQLSGLARDDQVQVTVTWHF